MLALVSAPLAGQPPDSAVLAAHWHWPTAGQARVHTLAAAAWLQGEADADDWPAEVDSIALRIERVLAPVGDLPVSLADGLLAWLLGMHENELAWPQPGFPEPDIGRVASLLKAPHAEGELARLQAAAAVHAVQVWQQVAERLGEDGGELIRAYWADVLGDSDAPDDAGDQSEYAHAQAQRVMVLAESESAPQRLAIRDALLRARAENLLHQEQTLEWVWVSLEALMRLLPAEENAPQLAEAWQAWLESAADEAAGNLRRIDSNLPVVVAQLGDAAGYLAGAADARLLAVDELVDVYARLGLFTSDMAFYLDQPVRDPVRRIIAQCGVDSLRVGPLSREVFDRCTDKLESGLLEAVSSKELVGESRGPFERQFLRRELRLVSWQRAAYLDGHLDWLLGTGCESADWFNVLDWAVLVDQLTRWVWQRPVLFAGERWHELANGLDSRARDLSAANGQWLACQTRSGENRHDPVMRLLAHHQVGLEKLSALMEEAREAFYQNTVRSGADVDLDSTGEQLTAYRPEGLVIGPCEGAQRCGARAELSVSRALTALFPNEYLLADQLNQGRLGLCYEQVRWVDRVSKISARPGEGLADYYGRLSFDLVGSFDRQNSVETVFRYRLTAGERSHYLFATEDEALIENDCPNDLIGSAIQTEFEDADYRGLMPNRLTYFAGAPTSAENELVSNWDRGAEWRDWFLTGRGIEQIEVADADTMKTVVRATLAEVRERRERGLYAPLTSPPRAGRSDEQLVRAMSDVADTAALLRRVLELHYPRVVREYEPVREMLAGDAGLITRDRVRLLRDQGLPAAEIPATGLERSRRFRDIWLELPTAVREQGQPAPELDFSLETIYGLTN